MWIVWDKQTDINGFSVKEFIERHKHLQNEETIFIKTVNSRVTQVEGKNILAKVYGIDASLPNEDFIAEYERIISESIVYEEVTNMIVKETEAIDLPMKGYEYEETNKLIENEEVI